MLKNLVLCGGSSGFPNMPERFEKVFNTLKLQLGPKQGPICETRAKVHGGHDRTQLGWLGGSILGSLSSFASMSIPRSDDIPEPGYFQRHGSYEEVGPAIVHRMCHNVSAPH